MTLETPTHFQRSPLVNSIHFLDWPMALDAIQPVSKVRLVAELDELGEFVHPFPGDWLAARIVLPQLLYRR